MKLAEKAVLLESAGSVLARARGLVMVPRLPALPKLRTGNPWTEEGDVYAECGVPGCRAAGTDPYHIMGTRATVRRAMAEHHRFYHCDEVAVVKLNQRKH